MRGLCTLILLLVGLTISQAARTTIKFWAVVGTDRDVEMYRQISADFERESGIHVEVTPLAWGNFETKYLTAMAAGIPPDVGLTNMGGPFKYGSIGGLLNLRKFRGSPELEAQFSPQMLPMFTEGDALYGVPFDLTTLTVFYRKSIFNKLGINRPPQTWNELNRAIDRVEAADYRYYFGWINGQQWALPLFTTPYGATGITTELDGSPKVNWQDPNYQEGVFQALRFWFMHDSPGRDLDSRVPGMFASSDKATTVPLMVNLHFLGTQIKSTHPEINDDWAIAKWPRADGGKETQIMGGTALVIFRDTKHAEDSFKWVQYLNSVKAQQKLLTHRIQRGEEANFTVSAVSKVYAPENNEFWQAPEFQSDNGMRQVIGETVSRITSQSSVVGADIVGRSEQNLLDRMNSYITGKLTAAAQSKGLSRTQFIQRMARGDYNDFRSKIESDIHTQLKKEYDSITPEAQATLVAEKQKYANRYGEIIQNLDSYRKKSTILDTGKVILGIIFIATFVFVFFSPKLRPHLASYLFIAVPLILAATFVFLPALVALYLSFTEYHPVLPLSTVRLTGTQNYQSAIASGDAAASFTKTALYAILTVPIGVVLSLILAYQLNLKVIGQRTWRFIFFSPMVTSVVSIALIFAQLFLSGREGWINTLLLSLHLVKDPIEFLNSEVTFPWTVITLAIWHGLAFTILIFIAGLQQVPVALYEAAEMDGASRSRQFWNIAIPGLRPQIFFITVLGIIGSFQVFETIYLLAGKSENAGAKFGPNGSALTVVPWLYNTAFENFEMGKASAIAYMLFAILLALTAVQYIGYRRKEQN
ncbi:MAG: extracellular solute-binding protein [Fimbriimonadaceae bacterium]